MTAEDRKEMADMAEKAQNPILKKRLQTRVAESEKVAKKLEIQKRKDKTFSSLKTSKIAAFQKKALTR